MSYRPEYEVGTKKYITTKRFGTTELTYQEYTLSRNRRAYVWVDEHGTIWALRRDTGSVDEVDRCGIGVLALPFATPMDPGCKTHDYMYESPAYQLFHTREEADDYMRSLHKQSTRNSLWRYLVQPFHYLARKLGAKYWEVEGTNN